MIEDEELERIKRKKLRELMNRFSEKEKNEEIPTIIKVNDDDFQEKVLELSKKVPVIVDFYADWCAPCRILSPTLEKIAREYKGKIVLAKVNVDESQIIAGEFNIMSVPTVIIFKDGTPIESFVGALPEPHIKDLLKRRRII